jgi:glycogen operon protein
MAVTLKISAGSHYPLGATVKPDGVNFALFSQNAREVSLLLFDDPKGLPSRTIALENRTKYTWHAFVHGLRPGQLYGYKVNGDHNPAGGARFNGNKLLLDPYAKALTGKVRNSENLLLAYDAASPNRDLSQDVRDNARIVPKCIAVDDTVFDWRDDAPPGIPLEKLFMYEVHVKGFTAHASSGAASPGTYLGFIDKIPHLKELGVNAVELLPVHEHYVEDFISAKGLTNYWGYNTIGFFAPESSYSTLSSPGCQVGEFKTLVRELHASGIEVILDVVFNHTGEGNELGPTISFRGIDNQTYYALTGTKEHPYRYYMNYSGCGNTLDLSAAPVIRLVMDSLRYWVEIMHVDGFRFDLASVLGREHSGFERSAGFFDTVSQDPVLQRVKLIAEPWDIGTYQLGNFPVDWSEWNGRFRDTARRFLKGDAGTVRDLGWRLTGSADLYGDDGRSAYNSINFITCHDGFTLHDLFSFNGKHNLTNGEENRDGSDDNASWNCGAEGDTDDPGVLALRMKLAKNAMCMLLLASGTPMILGGDEFFRTQGGNNNAYCQDNGISWFDWNWRPENEELFGFTKRLIALCGAYPVLQRRKYLTSLDTNGNAIPDHEWLGIGGEGMRWDDDGCRSIGFALDGGLSGDPGGAYRLFLFFNSHTGCLPFKPPLGGKRKLYRLIDTSLRPGDDILIEGFLLPLDKKSAFEYLVSPRSVIVLAER